MCAALGVDGTDPAAPTAATESVKHSLSAPFSLNLTPFPSKDGAIDHLSICNKSPTHMVLAGLCAGAAVLLHRRHPQGVRPAQGQGFRGMEQGPAEISAPKDYNGTAHSGTCVHDASDALPVNKDHTNLIQGSELELNSVLGDFEALHVQVAHHSGPSTGSVIDAAAQWNSLKDTAAPSDSPSNPNLIEIVEVAMAAFDIVDRSREHRRSSDTLRSSNISISTQCFSGALSSFQSDCEDGDSLPQVSLDTCRLLSLANPSALARSIPAIATATAVGTPRPPPAAARHWEVDPNHVHIGSRLAVGGSAEVFLGKYQGTLVAVKLLLDVDSTSQERFAQEIAVMASLRHPNLVLFMGYATNPHLAILAEYMQHGSLFKVLRCRGDTPLEPRLQRSVAVSVARGMAYLHSRSPPLLHLDLKSPNILVDKHWRVKIADFGMSKSRLHTHIAGDGFGTPEWMAPEVLKSERVDEKADVYSYGVVLWECLTGKAPWEGMHSMQVMYAVGFQGRTLPLPTNADPFLTDICRCCMAPAAQERPSFAEILAEMEAEYAPQAFRRMSSRLSDSGNLSSLPGRENGCCCMVDGSSGVDHGVAGANGRLEHQAVDQSLHLQEGNLHPESMISSPETTTTTSISSPSPFAAAAMTAFAIGAEGDVCTDTSPASSISKPDFDTLFAHVSPFGDSDSDGETEDASQAANVAAAMQSAML